MAVRSTPDQISPQPYLPNLSPATLWNAVEATRSALIVTDAKLADDPIIYCNQAFIDLTGYQRNEILGKNCRFLQGKDTDRQTVTKMRAAINQKKDIRLIVKNYRKNGQPFWNDLVMSPVFDAGGDLTHFVGLQLDVSDRVNFEQQLRSSQRELQRSNKELEQFTYAASHDLQEPLRMVSSYLQLIEKRYADRLDEDGLAFIAFASEGAQRMQALVNDLLTLSRVRTAARNFRDEDLNDILEVVLLNLQAAIRESGAEITHDTLPRLQVDRTQIMQLLQNLLSNAIKYRHPNRPPRLHIAVERQRQAYSFTVSDNGIGIEPQYRERIFGVFQRLHTRSEYPGTGVGLAICGKIIERHNGRITVESEPGKGSRFIFTLPTKQKEQAHE